MHKAYSLKHRHTMSISDLPETVLLKIAQYLTAEDLNSCFHVCKRWKKTLNSNKLWKRCCNGIPEKYLIHSEVNEAEDDTDTESISLCSWRVYYEQVCTVQKNWREGTFVVEKLNDSEQKHFCTYSNFVDHVDDDGNHWLFAMNESSIKVWNITRTPVEKSKYTYPKLINQWLPNLWRMKDKIVQKMKYVVNIFEFKYPAYDLKLQQRVNFANDVVTQEEPAEEQYWNVDSVIVDNFLVGYLTNTTNVHRSFLHIWDLESASKIGKCSTFQQSFVDFILERTGTDISQEFHGDRYLQVFSGDSARILITLKHNGFNLYQISIFNLNELKFVNVVARVHNWLHWCDLKGDLVVVHHADDRSPYNYLISIYHASGQLLTSVDCEDMSDSGCYIHSCIFRFTKSRIIIKANKSALHVFTIKDSKILSEKKFDVCEKSSIITHFYPDFLLLYNEPNGKLEVWDVDVGNKLWELGNIDRYGYRYGHYQNLPQKENTTFTSKLIVHFKGDDHLSVLNFKKNVSETTDEEKKTTALRRVETH